MNFKEYAVTEKVRVYQFSPENQDEISKLMNYHDIDHAFNDALRKYCYWEDDEYEKVINYGDYLAYYELNAEPFEFLYPNEYKHFIENAELIND